MSAADDIIQAAYAATGSRDPHAIIRHLAKELTADATRLDWLEQRCREQRIDIDHHALFPSHSLGHLRPLYDSRKPYYVDDCAGRSLREAIDAAIAAAKEPVLAVD